MKKIILTLAAAVLCSTAFAKTWTNNVGVGFAFPSSRIGVNQDNADDIVQVAYAVQGSYIGVHESGFVVKAESNLGLATSNDVKVQGNNTNAGFFDNFVVGAGWAFVNTESTLFGFTGCCSVDLNIYSKLDDREVSSVRHTYTTSMVNVLFGIGGDLFVRKRVSDHFGVYANVSGRYLPGGVSVLRHTDEYDTDDDTIKTSSSDSSTLIGKFTIEPSVGFMWTF